jgi:hypothetical protein
MSHDIKPLDLGEDYRKVLNHHGYAFQYSVIEFMAELRRQQRSDWELEAAEFPVSVQQASTRIDFIFRKTRPHVYLIGECKRVNPALSNWCFAGSAYVKGSSSLDKLTFQSAWVPAPSKELLQLRSRIEVTRMLTGVISSDSQSAYHVGLSVRSNQPGDSHSKNTDAIEDAAGQVCKGLNGLIEHFNSQRLKLPQNEILYFLPAIFTTARILTTDVDLASANIDKGEFESGSISVKEAPWVWYQYHLSPALKHTAPTDERKHLSPFDLAGILEQENKRSIAIVSVKGIEDFLHRGFPYR